MRQVITLYASGTAAAEEETGGRGVAGRGGVTGVRGRVTGAGGGAPGGEGWGSGRGGAEIRARRYGRVACSGRGTMSLSVADCVLRRPVAGEPDCPLPVPSVSGGPGWQQMASVVGGMVCTVIVVWPGGGGSLV